MSGHSKWSKVKYKKAIEDEKKGKIFSKLSKMISLIAREKGGNPETNSDLKIVIDKARSFNMPQDNIEKAIKKGTGGTKGVKLESLLLEAFGPGGISILIKVVTDNKNRSLSEIRKIIESLGGKMASGSVLWQFEKRGLILVKLKGNDKEKLELLAIEAGAEDIKEKDEFLEIYTRAEKIEDVKKLLEKKIIIEEANLDLIPKEEIEIQDKTTREKINNLFEVLDENDDVQEIYSNLKE
jgi:YebC/PmpR family DNA-binding regulatory protein